MIDWIEIIKNLKQKYYNNDYQTSLQFRDIEWWLKYKHPIEEIFENFHQYNKIVKKELKKLERKKKLYEIYENNNNKQ